MQRSKWYQLNNTSEVISPSLLVYPERIKKNIQQMVEIAGGTEFLRPHIKTHKMAEIVQLQMDAGIFKFKCATIAEAELLGQCGAKDILLAMQPVATNMHRFFTLMETYSKSKFSTLIDNSKTLDAFIGKATSKNTTVDLWLDIDNGMHRTGIPVGSTAETLYERMVDNPYINARGLHAYDGHINQSDFDERKKVCDAAFEPVSKLRQRLESKGLGPVNMVIGGSPTFPFHSKRANIETSPGTTLLWDERYSTILKDMYFLTSSVLITRIISKPGSDLLCFDLGHKSIAPEMPFPRVKIFGLEHCEQIGQSEEHLVVRCKNADNHEIGDTYYAIPMHICPTVAKYESVSTVEDHKITGSWKVAARNQKITI
ncbi:D-TA family PLP-dependent enzyme [Maribacter polysiphoniae]|uniref:D-TA family PLP-dependent enzyme n=1 Tax=Maribacter polysiphoniae TaxID=429344 RepID=A0A316E951_9FLAO|nr:D-TA family PLP-dependent enzyme [Maribacter polysiphoniae]MBD1260435.1 D-TA family PLP-dependent enzyme [Maribacter polysiphoniae]PWK25899.1 D-serine deaminase-like pyridoxal phosphate-dependent protein [Maribacter polysiphoniae]